MNGITQLCPIGTLHRPYSPLKIYQTAVQCDLFFHINESTPSTRYILLLLFSQLSFFLIDFSFLLCKICPPPAYYITVNTVCYDR